MKTIIHNQPEIEASYASIRQSLVGTYNKVYSEVNTVMVGAYWEIREQIYKFAAKMREPNMGSSF